MTEVVTQPGILASLGLNVELFVAQLLNFSILLLVLWRFAYKPLLKIMDERTEKIEAGLKNAEEAKVLRKRASSEHAHVLAEARGEVQEILEKAREEARAVHERSMAETHTEIEKQIESARERFELERQTMMKSMKKDVVHLVVQVSEQVIGEHINEDIDEAYIQRVIKSIDRSS
ncbi:F0F1 ATP synthase subunit B [Patescibacteria group bacterium]|nr:F0F1 ATP synthase subunit B [Patescibacteria group bacterium]